MVSYCVVRGSSFGLTWVIPPRSIGTDLDDRLLVEESEMGHAGGKREKAARRQCGSSALIEGSAHSKVAHPRYHRDDLLRSPFLFFSTPRGSRHLRRDWPIPTGPAPRS